MEALLFIVCITVLYAAMYSICFVLIFLALILGYFTADAFLDYLALIGSFIGFFFPILNKFLNKIKSLSNEEINSALQKFNLFYVYSTFSIILSFGFGLILGITLDILNIGFTHKDLKILFLLLQSGIGLYSGNLINSLFEYINKVMDLKIELAKHLRDD